MNRHYRDCLRVCRAAGLTPRGIEHRGKHFAVVCAEGLVFCPSTPSDRRSRNNLQAFARRLARATAVCEMRREQ